MAFFILTDFFLLLLFLSFPQLPFSCFPPPPPLPLLLLIAFISFLSFFFSSTYYASLVMSLILNFIHHSNQEMVMSF